MGGIRVSDERNRALSLYMSFPSLFPSMPLVTRIDIVYMIHTHTHRKRKRERGREPSSSRCQDDQYLTHLEILRVAEPDHERVGSKRSVDRAIPIFFRMQDAQASRVYPHRAFTPTCLRNVDNILFVNVES